MLFFRPYRTPVFVERLYAVNGDLAGIQDYFTSRAEVYQSYYGDRAQSLYENLVYRTEPYAIMLQELPPQTWQLIKYAPKRRVRIAPKTALVLV